jgi:hypothetical protein
MENFWNLSLFVHCTDLGVETRILYRLLQSIHNILNEEDVIIIRLFQSILSYVMLLILQLPRVLDLWLIKWFNDNVAPKLFSSWFMLIRQLRPQNLGKAVYRCAYKNKAYQ